MSWIEAHKPGEKCEHEPMLVVKEFPQGIAMERHNMSEREVLSSLMNAMYGFCTELKRTHVCGDFNCGVRRFVTGFVDFVNEEVESGESVQIYPDDNPDLTKGD